MVKRKGSFLVIALLLTLWFPRMLPGAEHFISSDQVDLVTLLPPPPVVGSTQAEAEIAEIIQLQKTESPEEKASAVADNRLSVFQLAAGVLGPKFSAENLPLTARFFERLGKEGGSPVGAAKSFWGKPRPFLVSKEIKPCAEASGGSYPSGHTTFSYLSAVILADMVPEKKKEIFDRAAQYARHRMVCGVHYRSDVEAGRTAGTVLAAFAMQSPSFRGEYETVRQEVRKVLGYE